MKILNFSEFANEANIEVKRWVYDVLELSGIKMRCLWDGENWHFYEREGKGTLEDFKNLPNNKNANFTINFDLPISIFNNEGELQKQLCVLKPEVKVHYFDMSSDDYDIDFVKCDNTDELVAYVQECEEQEDDFVGTLIKQAWDEEYVSDKLKDELEDCLGKQDFESMREQILQKLIEGISSLCER